MQHSRRTFWWDTLVENSCGTIFWDTLVGLLCGTVLWDTFASTLLFCLMGHSRRTLLLETPVEHSLLWKTLVGYSRATLLWCATDYIQRCHTKRRGHRQSSRSRTKRRIYTSMLSFTTWHGLTQTHFPPRPLKTAWHSDITDVL